MYPVQTSIEIAASPETVRSKFLDFPQIPNYHKGHFKSLSPVTPNKPLEVGDRVHVVLEGMTFDATVLENSPAAFAWRGSIPLLFVGDHFFRFEPSKTTPGGTTFVQEELFSGLLSPLMGESFLANVMKGKEKTKKGFEAYNRDFKAWCEGTKSRQ